MEDGEKPSILPDIQLSAQQPQTDSLGTSEYVPSGMEAPMVQWQRDETDLKVRQHASTLGESLHTAAREVVPFFRELEDDRPLFPSFAFEEKPIDFSDPEVQEVIREIGYEHNKEALQSNSFEELVNMRDQLKAAKTDIQYMSENHGFAGSMALYMAASIIDPTSYLGYTLAGRMYNLAKVTDRMGKMGTAGRAASYAAAPMAIEGASEYYIQSHGAREYESVGATMLFAGTLGGGGSLFIDTIRRQKSQRTQKAFDDITKNEVTLRSNPEQARKNLDAIFNEDNISPYRSKIIDAFPNIFKRWKNSPTFLAYERGGVMAALASRFDTMAGLSATKGAVFGKNDEMIYTPDLNNGRTAMDVKYEMMENFVMLEYSRLQEYKKYYDAEIKAGRQPMSKEDYSTQTYQHVSDMQQAYRTRKLHHIDQVQKDNAVMEDVAGVVDRNLEKDDAYKKLDTDEARADYRETQIEAEVNHLAAQRMKDEPEFQNTAPDEFKGMVDALNTYYEATRMSMELAGIPYARTMDSRFYQPLMYNKAAVMADQKAAIKAFEEAIKDSADYKFKLNEAHAKYEAAKQQKSKLTEAERNALEIKIQTIEAKLDDLEAARIRIEAILEDPSIPLMNKAIEINGYMRMSGSMIDDTMDRGFKVGGDIYSRGYYYVENEFVHSINGRIVDEDTWSKPLYDGTAKPLTHSEFESMKSTFPEDMVGSAAERDVREAIKNLIDQDKNIAEILNATGTRVEDFVGINPNSKDPYGPYSGENREIGGDIIGSPENMSKMLANEQTVVHEVMHNLGTEMRANKLARQDIVNIQNEIKDRYDDIEVELNKNGLWLDSPSTVRRPDGSYETIRDRLDYMTNLKEDELFAVGLSNPDIAMALNNVMAREKIKGRRVSLFAKMMNAIKNYLGIEKIKKGSILDNIQNVLQRNAVARKNTVSETKLHQEYRTKAEEVRVTSTKEDIAVSDLEFKIDQIEGLEETALAKGEAELAALKEKPGYKELIKERTALKTKATKAKNAAKKAGEAANAAAQKIVDYKNNQIANMEEKFNSAKNDLQKQESELKAAQGAELEKAREEYKDIQNAPAAQARGTVQTLSETGRENELAALGFGNTGALKKRKLNLNPNHEAIKPFVRNNEADINNMYQYSVSGRAAVMNATGFTDVNEYMKYLYDNGKSFTNDDLTIAKDLFELTLGTRQLADNPNAFSQDAIKLVKSANYLTMGGQFAQYGLSEIGAGVYATGFRYLLDLIPGLKTTAKMYAGKNLDKMEVEMIRLTEAGDIWHNNASAKYGDYNEISSGFIDNPAVKMAGKSARFMFRFSGLEGISTITKIWLPRSYMGRIIKQAGDGKSHYDLIRWGITPEDMLKIKEQPVTRNKNGDIIDFNFEGWKDQELVDKFQRSVSRMSRDAILRPDATRIPAWLNDGNRAYTLFGQFQSFAFMANERLFQRGFSEERSMAIVGAMISAALIGLMGYTGERLAIATGLMKEDEAKFDLEEEEGMIQLGKYMAFRHSFVGTPQMMAEAFVAAQEYNGGDRVIGRAGGPSVGRVQNMAKAAKEFGWEGKIGTRSQMHVLKSSIPFNNMIGVDNMNKSIINDMYQEQKRRDFDKHSGFKGLGR